MFTFGKPAPAAASPASPVNQLRARQVEEFIKYNRSAQLIKPDTYKMIIPTQFGGLSFQIYLPPRFPEVPPILNMLVRVQHAWIDQNMRVVGHPKLKTWSVHHHLGKLINEIYAEFSRNPPAPASAQAPAPAGVGSRALANPQQQQQQQVGHQRNPSAQQQAPIQQPPPVEEKKIREVLRAPVPKIPDSFPALQTMSSSELELLLNTPSSLSTFIDGLDSVKNSVALRDSMYKDVEGLARKNLSRQEEVKEWEGKVSTSRKEVEEMKVEYDKLVDKKSKIMQRYSLKNVLDALETAIMESEEESDKLKERFQGNDSSDDDDSDFEEEDIKEKGAMTMDKFSKRYLKVREKLHQRAAKQERLKEIYGPGPR